MVGHQRLNHLPLLFRFPQPLLPFLLSPLHPTLPLLLPNRIPRVPNRNHPNSSLPCQPLSLCFHPNTPTPQVVQRLLQLLALLLRHINNDGVWQPTSSNWSQRHISENSASRTVPLVHLVHNSRVVALLRQFGDGADVAHRDRLVDQFRQKRRQLDELACVCEGEKDNQVLHFVAQPLDNSVLGSLRGVWLLFCVCFGQNAHCLE
ncbi:hypothetical protein BLNAU_13598 [Blattamonas nauphoetae]|uniref:Uncharacterized protein n=1 Tax=Blattamonas nauphoetae TaxID=2049346 RepID=A0ABQ9XG49_9EUKA|nr:hypothetical protein BLNAU_13598 [Blattamonas nauphoetae]